MSQNKAPNCHQCEHFQVSWDRRFPLSCSYLGFKGKKVPSMEVFEATGKHCVWFKPKAQAEAEPAEEPEDYLPPGSSITFTA